MSDFAGDFHLLDGRLTDVSAVAGGVVWTALVVGGPFRRLEELFLLAPLVLVPLLLGTVFAPTRDGDSEGRSSRWYRYAVLGQPIGALLVAVSFAFDEGVLAGLLVVPWVVVTLAVALCGLERLLPRGLEPLAELSIDAGLLYVTVGSGWLLLSRLGMNPLGFGDPIVFFTSVHFHYAGFVLPILAGVTGRVVDGVARRVYAFAAVTIVFGPGLIATGITLSPLIEVLAVAALTVGVTAFALVTLLVVVPSRANRYQQAALTVSSLAVAVSMVFAFGYGLSVFTGSFVGLGIETMVAYHGHLNALGFALFGGLGWRIALPPRATDRNPPFSSLTADRRVGADYLERNHITGPASPPGQMDDLTAYARSNFDPDSVHPAIRSFYEQTADYELRYEVTWHPGFRMGALLASRLTARVEQLALPAPGTPPQRTESHIVDIDDSVDGRTGARAWIRTETETGDAVFVAAYATHEHDGETYMNIGLPLPLCNLSAILWMDSIDLGGDSAGVRLSSSSSSSSRTRPEGDEGLYLITPFVPLRLPMHEDFRVWPADASQAPKTPSALCTDETALIARHDMWLFGKTFLTIYYAIEHES